MNVSLTPEQQAFVEQNLQSGRYHTAAEVIREGLRLMRISFLWLVRRIKAARALVVLDAL